MGAVGGLGGVAALYFAFVKQLDGDFVKTLWVVGPPLLLIVALFVLAARQLRNERQGESEGSTEN